LDDTAPEDDVAVVEDDRLSWTDGSLRLMESNLESGSVSW
jgi:hypothetical protein